MHCSEVPLQSRVPGNVVRVTAQVITQQPLIPRREGAGLDNVQVVRPCMVRPATVEQPARHADVVELVAQLEQLTAAHDNPVQVVARRHQVDDRLSRQAGYGRAADVLDRAEQPWQRGRKFGYGLAGQLRPVRVVLSEFERHKGRVAAAGPQRPGLASYAPVVPYRGQFDHLVREADRGRAILNTRTIAVFDDGLVVCAVPVYGDPAKPDSVILSWLRGGARTRGRNAGPGRGSEQVRTQAERAGSAVTFAPTWRKAQLIPLAIIEKVVLTRPQQVSELAIYVQSADPASPDKSTYLGDLSAEAVRGTLGPVLGDRLRIDIPR